MIAFSTPLTLLSHGCSCRWTPLATVSPLTGRKEMRIQTSRARVTPRMALRAVEAYDGAFGLDSDVRDALVRRLTDAEFAVSVAKQAQCERSHFTGDLFQPIPYSVATPRGMPADIEAYSRDPNFTIINIPPTVMFEARCFKPSRLCAVFRLYGVSASQVEAHAEQERRRDAEIQLRAETSHAKDGQTTDSPMSAVPDGQDAWSGIGSLIAQTLREADVPLSEEEERELDDLVV